MNEETGELPLTLENMVANVAYWRMQIGHANAMLDELEQEFRERHAGLYSERDEARRMVEEAEAELRAAVVNEFNATGKSRPHPACSVRFIKQLEYDDATVVDWAIRRAPALLSIDRKKLKETGITLGAPIREIEVPTAAIATNLSSWTGPRGDAGLGGQGL
jgi:hypothetical protein